MASTVAQLLGMRVALEATLPMCAPCRENPRILLKKHLIRGCSSLVAAAEAEVRSKAAVAEAATPAALVATV
jgi:hypothetical protein